MDKSIKNFLILALIALTLFLFWYLRTVVAYLLISVVLSIVGAPLTEFLHKIHLRKIKMPYALCAGITLLIMISVIIGAVFLFVPLILEQTRIISSFDFGSFVKLLNGPFQDLRDFIAQYRLANDVPVDLFIQEKLTGLIDVANVPLFLSSLVSFLGNLFVAFISISFMTFFFLKDRDLFLRAVLAVTPDTYLVEVKDIMRNTRRMLRRYFSGLILDVVVIATLVAIGLSLLGVKNALLIGFFAGMMNVIPYIGPFIGFLFGLFIAITTNVNLNFVNDLSPLLVRVSLVFFGVRMLDDMLFQPYIFSNSVKAHPLEIFVVILAAASIGGVVGMVIAVPAYTFLRIIAKEFFSKSKLVMALTKNL